MHRFAYVESRAQARIILLSNSEFNFLQSRQGSVSQILSTLAGCVAIFLALRGGACPAEAGCN